MSRYTQRPNSLSQPGPLVERRQIDITNTQIYDRMTAHFPGLVQARVNNK